MHKFVYLYEASHPPAPANEAAPCARVCGRDTSIGEFYVCVNKVLFYYFDSVGMWRGSCGDSVRVCLLPVASASLLY